MKQLKLFIIIGTRGQFIKTAPVLLELDKRGIPYKFINTGQHTKSSQEISKLFSLRKPDNYLTYRKEDSIKIEDAISWFFLALFRGIQSFGNLRKTGGGICVIHGDTLSTLLGLILAKISGLKVAHIESGLTSNSLIHPFPEEIIRRIVSRFSDYLFSPSDWAYNNLFRKKSTYNLCNSKLNTVYDSIKIILNKEANLNNTDKYVVVTLHRNELIYQKNALINAIQVLVNISHDLNIIFVIHKPTENRLKKYKLYEKIRANPKIKICSYFNYGEFINLVSGAEFVITDGGGLQEETFYLNVPCLILRKRTERICGLGSTALLSEMDNGKIMDFLSNYNKYKHHKIFKSNPSKIIVDRLEELLKQ